MTGTNKIGNARKSRRLRLNISSGSGAAQKFTPEAADWQRIEFAYGHQFSEADRDGIVAVVNKYFFWQPSEARAPFVDDAIRYLDRLERAAKRFWDVLLEQSGSRMRAAAHAPIISINARQSVSLLKSNCFRCLPKWLCTNPMAALRISASSAM